MRSKNGECWSHHRGLRSGGVQSRGIQEEIRCRTQEAPSVPDRSRCMKLAELEKRKGHGSRIHSGLGLKACNKDRSGRAKQFVYTQTRCLIRRITQRWESPLQGEGPDGST